MLAQFVLGLLLAYVGMVALCQGLERHFKQIWKRAPSPLLRHALRLAGWLLLAASFSLCVRYWGWAMGPVGWFGQISLAALLLVFVLPYYPRLALWPLLWLGRLGR